MKFQEPRIEFVKIDMSLKTTDSSNCTDETNLKMASGEDCINSGAPQNNCVDKSDMF